MREQQELIAAGEWDMLIIMDAARADIAREVCDGVEVETVRSPAQKTAGWITATRETFAALRPLWYLSCNPVVDATLQHLSPAFNVLPLWKTFWGWHTPKCIPSVHPLVAAGAAWVYMSEVWGPGRRYVVHLLAPHFPFVGYPALDTTKWKTGEDATARSFEHMIDPRTMDSFDPVLWCRAYVGNLRLAWDAARNLAYWHGGRVAVTADHGDLLGEDGLWGHALEHELLHEVPWIVMPQKSQGELVHDKLEALGYA